MKWAFLLPVSLLAGLPGAVPSDTGGACALELILATDVSGSIDRREYALQARGLAKAFADPRLTEAVEALKGGLLITHLQWTGKSRQRQVTPWRLLTDAGSVRAYGAELGHSERVWRNYSTAIGEALAYAERISAGAPQSCRRRVIDISGDGVSNEGRAPGIVSRRLAGRGYVINGLVIKGADPDPEAHFKAEVIAGAGAFVEIARDFDDYPRAILRKLLREIGSPPLTARLGRRSGR